MPDELRSTNEVAVRQPVQRPQLKRNPLGRYRPLSFASAGAIMHRAVEVIIEPGHTVDDLAIDSSGLAEHLAAQVPEASFRVVPKELVGRGLTWWETIRIYLPVDTIAKAAVGAMLSESVRWLRERFKKVPKRPKYVAIYGPDGKVITSVVLHDPTAEPEDRTAIDAHEPPRFPPAGR